MPLAIHACKVAREIFTLLAAAAVVTMDGSMLFTLDTCQVFEIEQYDVCLLLGFCNIVSYRLT